MTEKNFRPLTKTRIKLTADCQIVFEFGNAKWNIPESLARRNLWWLISSYATVTPIKNNKGNYSVDNFVVNLRTKSENEIVLTNLILSSFTEILIQSCSEKRLWP